MDDLKTILVAVLDCKQNVSFIVLYLVVFFMKRIYHFCCKFGIVLYLVVFFIKRIYIFCCKFGIVNLGL